MDEQDKSAGAVLEEDFEACFKVFDKDKSGSIEKDEMVEIIKKFIGLEKI